MTEADPPNKHETPEAILKAAKETFSRTILDNDVLFAAIRKVLNEQTHTDEEVLPDFELEPWRPVSGVEGKQAVGIRLTQAGAPAGEFDELAISLSLYSYLPVVDLDLKTGEGRSSNEVKEQGTAEAQSQAMYYFWEAYITFLKDIGVREGKSGEIIVDPMSGTFDLREELENRHYNSYPKE